LTPFNMSTASVEVSNRSISWSVKPSFNSAERSVPLNFMLQIASSAVATPSDLLPWVSNMAL
jgi:hypothetical protein